MGPPSLIESELARHPDVDRGRVRVIEAPDVIAMEEAPARALRRKPAASIRVAAETVAKGEAAAVFSAGIRPGQENNIRIRGNSTD